MTSLRSAADHFRHVAPEFPQFIVLSIPEDMTQEALLPVAYFTGTDFKLARHAPPGITRIGIAGDCLGPSKPSGRANNSIIIYSPGPDLLSNWFQEFLPRLNY
jgi:hypothetical protein